MDWPVNGDRSSLRESKTNKKSTLQNYGHFLQSQIEEFVLTMKPKNKMIFYFFLFSMVVDFFFLNPMEVDFKSYSDESNWI